MFSELFCSVFLAVVVFVFYLTQIYRVQKHTAPSFNALQKASAFFFFHGVLQWTVSCTTIKDFISEVRAKHTISTLVGIVKLSQRAALIFQFSTSHNRMHLLTEYSTFGIPLSVKYWILESILSFLWRCIKKSQYHSHLGFF